MNRRIVVIQKRTVFCLRWLLLLSLLLGLAACQSEPDAPEADVQATVGAAVSLTVAAQTANSATEQVAQATQEPTLPPVPTQIIETPTVAATAPPPATSTPPPTSSPIPTETIEATAVPTETPTTLPANQCPCKYTATSATYRASRPRF